MDNKTNRIKRSIISMLDKISEESDLIRIHNFIQRIYLKK